MRKTFTILSLLLLTNIIAQNNVSVLDSIKIKVLKDTLLFKKVDIYENSIGIFNKNEYSPVFAIDEKYLYKLDIIEPSKVKAFISEFLIPDRIERIIILKPDEAEALYGSHGKKGAILIYFNSENYNPEIANLKINKRKWGNNFSSEKTQGLFGN